MATTQQQRKKRKNKKSAQEEAEEAAEAEAKRQEEEEKERRKPWYEKLLDILNSPSLQTCLYLAFVFIFQTLANTLRLPEEYYMDKHVMDRFVENHFDSSHNTFESVRRTADIYEWGNNVLWPGFFSDGGPCNSYVGLPNAHAVKGCNDDVWPDGEGSFHLDGATPLGLQELVRRMDQLDWTEGLTIRTARVSAQQCDGTHQLGAPRPASSPRLDCL